MRAIFLSLFFISFFLNHNYCYGVTKKTPGFIQESKSSKQLDQEVLDRYSEENPWGMNVSIDLYEADAKLIRDPKYVKQFMIDLVKFIDMKAYGAPIVVDFGDTPRVAGISAMQLIETSSITAHFANFSNSVHIDIFSCKAFSPHKAALFCRQYFKAEEMKVSPVVFRF
ncbi:MAG: S-adenosylmethionine decarboxylase proenzyme [Candidatus Anoxychlamydiales bacterium]|nr:S-adenosylmethionine decarboxylase proenzyme [Candidatus Anoxychlamydiales bacterium]